MAGKLVQLTPEQLVQKEKEFQLMQVDSQKSAKTWNELHEYFQGATYSDVQVFWNSYWRWYVELTWKRLNALPQNVMINTVVGLQIPMATMLGFDVWEGIIWYLGIRTKDDDEMKLVYTKMQDAFLKSKALLGKRDGTDLTLGTLANEIKSLGQKGDDSLNTAEFKSKLMQVIDNESKAVRQFRDISPNEVVEELISISSFFLGVVPDNIAGIVDVFLHPELIEAVKQRDDLINQAYEDLTKEAKEKGLVIDDLITEPTKPTKFTKPTEILAEEIESEIKQEETNPKSTTVKKEEIIPESIEKVKENQESFTEPEPEPEQSVVEKETETKKDTLPSPSSPYEGELEGVKKQEENKVQSDEGFKLKEEYKNKIEESNKPETKQETKQETKEETSVEKTPEPAQKPSYTDIKQMVNSRFADKNGKIENVEGVLALLSELAEQDNDEKIGELYYFDEDKGDFGWDNDLLKST